MEDGFSPLTALSPLDGRYFKPVHDLRKYFSELALNQFRLEVEVEYLIFFLSKITRQPLSSKAKDALRLIATNFDESEALVLKQIEAKTHHDIKAIEYYLRQKMEVVGLDVSQWVHFALTSEDVNSLAYARMLKLGLTQVIIPELEVVLQSLKKLIKSSKNQPMLARTHGQPAVPTTLGKEMAVFALRLKRELNRLKKVEIEGKITGAVGNYNALALAYPDLNIIKLTDSFVKSLGLSPNHFTTQIIPAESYSHVFQSLLTINSILIDFDQDQWRYISDRYFIQATQPGEVGSSTMPQKVNPIDFENSEGNLGLANALLVHFCTKLPISRLQRDLSDSTVKRNFGAALGYCLLGYQSCRKGLAKLKINQATIEEDLLKHWEVVAEGIQTLLRQSGDTQAYEKLKTLSQGKNLTQAEIKKWVSATSLSPALKQKILQLTPLSYLGLSTNLVSLALKELDEN